MSAHEVRCRWLEGGLQRKKLGVGFYRQKSLLKHLTWYYSTADWSWTIFQPSGNLRKINVNSPCGVFPSDIVRWNSPRTNAASGPSISIRRFANSSLPISCPAL